MRKEPVREHGLFLHPPYTPSVRGKGKLGRVGGSLVGGLRAEDGGTPCQGLAETIARRRKVFGRTPKIFLLASLRSGLAIVYDGPFVVKVSRAQCMRNTCSYFG